MTGDLLNFRCPGAVLPALAGLFWVSVTQIPGQNSAAVSSKRPPAPVSDPLPLEFLGRDADLKVTGWIRQLIVLGAGLIIAGHAVLTPLLQALSMLTNDFVTMARAADRAGPSAYPNIWRIRNLTFAAVPLGSFRLLYLVTILGLGWYWLRLSPDQM